jgi:YHS domain-containing protein
MPLPRRPSRLIAALAVTLMLGGCGAWVAQNPGTAYSPVNAVAEGDTPRLMLKGADVVAYFTEGRHRQGEPAFTSQHEGITFRFASAEHKALFDQGPGPYLPQFGGYCANGIAYAIPWGGDADTWRIIDGKLYIFGGQASRDAFELDEKRNLALAEGYWKEEIAGGNSFLQRAKRLLWRVPHYRSGEELAQAVARAKAGGGTAAR